MDNKGLLSGIIGTIAVNAVTGENNTIWAAVKLD